MQGAKSDALHALSCAVRYNVHWLMRVLLRKAGKALLCLLQGVAAGGEQGLKKVQSALRWIVAHWAMRARAGCSTHRGTLGRSPQRESQFAGPTVYVNIEKVRIDSENAAMP